MKTQDFMYDLPEECIAQTPAEPRDSSRLMVLNRHDRSISDRHFYDIKDYLKPGDIMVINETRVIPARLLGVTENGGNAEILLLRELSYKRWEALVKPGRRLKPGKKAFFGDGRLEARITSQTEDGGRIVELVCEGPLEAVLDELGQMPLPPYIHEKLEDGERYQTVYSKYRGSAAAPTAGLHFTQALLEDIRRIGVDIVPVLLHVGLGTFRPVKAENIEDHKMHSEYWQITDDSARRINRARSEGRRVICVGTTSVRTLESAAGDDGLVKAGSGMTDIFISPGYKWKITDALITNFHLPGSTLIMLVSAFAGREFVLEAYNRAVKTGYRFFSFGDAMFIE